MDRKLIERLSQVTDEEKAILNGSRELDKSKYFQLGEDVVQNNKFLHDGRRIAIRPHTRFIEFPRHKHDYVEVVYVCQGSLRHVINGEEVLQETGDLLLINQYTYHEIREAGAEDVAVNFIILPQFFDKSLTMIDKNNMLAAFLIGTLRKGAGETQYLHFSVGEIFEIQNLIEILIYSLLKGEDEDNTVNDVTMGMIFFYLIKYMECLKTNRQISFEDIVLKTAMQYIDDNYKTATLSELANNLSISLSTLSRSIKTSTGHTFTELLQKKRFQMAMTLMCDTDLSINEIIWAVGYESNSYFYRTFKSKYNISPKEYRRKHKRGDIIKF